MLAALIGELVMNSPEFTATWSAHPVRAWDIATYRMRHPLVGAVDVTQQAMPVPDGPGQRIVAVTAAAGSASQAALTLLAQAVAPGEQTRPAGTTPELEPIADTRSVS